MSENPSRRDSDLHSKEKLDPCCEKPYPEESGGFFPELSKKEHIDEKTEAKIKGKERRKRWSIHFKVDKKSLKHIFGTDDEFSIFIQLFVFFILAVLLIIPYSWLYFSIGIEYPLRQIFYILSSIFTIIGIVGLLHYFFPEWYVD